MRLAAEEADKVMGRVRQAMDEGRRIADGLRQSMSSERKARARETVERLKQQLLQLAPVLALNPKAAASVLRQMTRQLADAVSDYARDGAPRTNAAPAPAAAASSSGAALSDPAASETTPSATAAADPAAQPVAAKAEPAARVTMTPGEASDVAAAARAAEREKARTAYQAAAGAQEIHAPDEKFLREARQVFERLKVMVRGMLALLEDEHQRKKEARAFDENAEIIEKGLAEIEGWSKEPAPIAPPVSPTAPVSVAV
ncbi:hypothetical protein A6A05_16570 [Magnetospirillum moscoviense]|uniref:Uncharacterized protein n=2 Tax=Magnetospirillum moscoviense TaxID=1437059 RepID=A0A178MD05_9PROT|nr:hypothetical protein A6A05_16570 [Magnetospirillum moscoviense]